MPSEISESIGSRRRGRNVRKDRADSAALTVAAPAGVLVTPATGNKIKLPTSGAEVIAGVGVLMYISSKSIPDTTTGLENAIGDMVNYMEGGDIDVIVEEAVTPASAVYARHTANGAGKLQLGAFRTDSDSGNATLVSGARFINSTSAAGVATLRINRPSGDASVAAAFERKAIRRTFTFADTDITGVAATTVIISLGDPLPANAVVESVHTNTTVAFTDGAAGTFTADLGVLSGDDDRFTPTALDIDSTGEDSETPHLPGNTGAGTTQLAVLITSNVNVGTSTAGSFVMTVYYYVPSSITVVAAP